MSKGLELLEKHIFTSELIKKWVMDQMLDSFKDEDVPEDFKQYLLQTGVDNDKIAVMIDVQPRFLFDFFDEQNTVIEIFTYPGGEFSCKIGKEATTNSWKTRKEAEFFAVEAAFEIVNNKIKEENDKQGI